MSICSFPLNACWEVINKLSIMPVLTLVTKNDYSYSIGYDFLNNTYLVGVAAKIKFRR